MTSRSRTGWSACRSSWLAAFVATNFNGRGEIAWTCRHLTARPPNRLFHLVFESPSWKGLGADSEEKREPVSDIDTAVLDSLKVLDPNGRLEKRT